LDLLGFASMMRYCEKRGIMFI